MITLKNEVLTVQISPKGAELTKLYHQHTEIDYLWNADAKFWSKHSPVLFPIVGVLKDDTYNYQNKKYSLPRHGFARDMAFTARQESETVASFSLSSDEETLKKYPFEFIFNIHYKLEADNLTVTYEVLNPEEVNLYFSVGGHPAFAVPLTTDSYYEDYYLEFECNESANRWPLSGNLISTASVPFLKDEKQVPLTKELFYEDALVLKNLQSQKISLLNHKNKRGIDFNFKGFPYLGIWAAKDAPFVCIEPWCGIADSVAHNQQLESKEGIQCLNAKQSWNRSWSVKCF